MHSARAETSATQPTAPQPTRLTERLHALDVLRGMALLGMILVHFHGHSLEINGVDELVRTAIWRLVETKSHGTFALLFGAGFALQMQRAEARGAPFAAIYLRRLAVLALFGIAAHVLFGFNVLLSYAVWGAPLLLIRRWSTRALIVTAVLSAVSLALFMLLARGWIITLHGHDAVEAAVKAREAQYFRINDALQAAIEQPDYGRLLAARFRHMAWFVTQPFFFVPGPTVTLFIAGMLAVRHHIFDQPLAHCRVVFGMMAFGLCAWIADNWIPSIHSGFGLLRDQWLAFTYVGGMLLLLARYPKSIGWLRPVGQVGRMALTNYLLQIAVLDLLFSGYALHLADLRPIYVPLATLLLFGAEAVASVSWLARFRFGPAEWAWRSLTYGRAQPMRR